MGIRQTNIYPSMRRYFTDKAAKALHKKCPTMLNQRNEEVGHSGLAELLSKFDIKSAREALDSGTMGYKRVVDCVMFLGSACSREELGLSAEKLIVTINDLADKGYITGAMAPLSIIELAEVVPADIRYAMISYVAITEKGQKYAESVHADRFFKEGGMPTKVGDQK